MDPKLSASVNSVIANSDGWMGFKILFRNASLNSLG